MVPRGKKFPGGQKEKRPKKIFRPNQRARGFWGKKGALNIKIRPPRVYGEPLLKG